MELQFDDAAARGLRRYVRLVGEALALRGDGACFELEPLACAYLALDQRLPGFPARDVALLWDEQHGWALAVESHSTEDLLVQTYLGIDVLPPPHVVAHFATRLLRDEAVDQRDPPDLRTVDIEDDLPQRLAAYAQPPRDLPRPEHAHSTVPAVVGDRAEHEPVPAEPGDGRLTVRAEHHGPHVVLHVSGDLDILTAPQLQQTVTHTLAHRPRLLILDLTDVRFLASAGMAVLINAHDAAQNLDQTQVRVVAAGPTVLRPLEVVGLAGTLTIYPTLHTALVDP